MTARAIDTTLLDTLRERWRAELDSSPSLSVADAVHSIIAKAIVEGELPPGWRLGEERLAEILGVSRTPVREALTRLAGSSLAIRDARGALRVDDLSPQRILDVYAVQGALEGLAAGLAAAVSTPLNIVELKSASDAFARAVAARDFARMSRSNTEFHSAIAATTKNEMLIHFLDEIHNWVRRIPNTTLAENGRADASIVQHRRIIDAIAGRQVQTADALSREHMREAEALRVAMFARQP